MKWFRRIGAAALGALFVASVRAEDIDLFLGIPGGTSSAPNVLFIIDNTANWSQTNDDGVPVYEPELQALANLLAALPTGPNGEALVNVGFMMFTETGGDNSNVDGGYVRAAIRPMDEEYKKRYIAMLGVDRFLAAADPNDPLLDGSGNLVIDGEAVTAAGFDENDDKSNSGKAGLAMAEAYRYFDGGEAYSGNNKAKTDYDGNVSGYLSETVCTGRGNNRECTTVNSLSGSQYVWDIADGDALTAIDGTTYTSPIADGFCGGNFIIWVGNGPAQDATADTREATGMLADAGGNTTQISITPSGSADNVADEWARFMRGSEHEIITFTLDIGKRTTGQGPGWTALLQSMAVESDGEYYDVDGNYQDILDALTDVFSRVLAINSVFASVALPASANAQSTFINQVFIGQFRPEETAKPRWYGNLKQYKLGRDSTGTLRVLDADDDPVVDSSTGFVASCARSFWTPDSTDSYWDFLPENDRRGDCLSVANSDVSNYPDGPVVEKGGHAYVLRSDALRTVYTCIPAAAGEPCGAGSPASFSVGNGGITKALLDPNDPGGLSDADRDALVAWAAGYDPDDENDNSSTADMRPSVHGDIIHTQPVAIDYADDPNDPDVAVFFGANDGLLHVINGNRALAHDDSTVAAGDEFWSFMPPEFLAKIKRLRDNDVNIRFPATGVYAGNGAEGLQKPYGFDGPITAYNEGVGEAKTLFAAMRRGGRSLYAFDVTDVESPSIKWIFGCPAEDSDANCSDGLGLNADVAAVGQTWSEASIALQPDATDADVTNAFLIMGGGYDDCEDFDADTGGANHDCTGSDKGNAVFVIDAATGDLLQRFDTERAVPGRVTVVPVSDADPNIAFAYFGDTGGNVYRIHAGTTASPASIGSVAPGSWTMTRIASLGCGDDDGCTAPRKFLFGPDVVRVPDSSRLMVLLGSGDREKPLEEYGAALSVQNRFFALIDEPETSGWFDDASGVGEDFVSLATSDTDFTEVTVASGAGEGSAVGQYGWHLSLAAGEQVVSGALTVADTVNFSTHIPVENAPGACETDLGTAQTYNISYRDGSGDTVRLIGGGLAPTPVAGKVILDDGEVVPFCIGCGGENSSIGGSQVTSSSTWTQPVSRVYWEIRK